MFTTCLIRKTAFPEDFKSGKDNTADQIERITEKENKIVNDLKLRFQSITEELSKIGVLSQEQKESCDKFYQELRNPVAHGLMFRLFEKIMGRPPKHFLEPDTESDRIFKKVSEQFIEKISEDIQLLNPIKPKIQDNEMNDT